MRKIAVFTGSRAEYGLLYWLMQAIKNDDELTLQVIASGAHFSPQHGMTVNEILADGFTIDAKVEMLLSSDSPNGVVKAMGLGLIGFADALSTLQPDMVIVLGDRIEVLAMAEAALVMKIPLVHLHGGELSMGAYDDAVRHAVTKMASLHFVANEVYRRRIIQMGEDPKTVFNVGAFGIEHIIKSKKLDFVEFIEAIQVPLRQPYFLVTYHPVTLDDESSRKGCESLLAVLDDYPDYQILFTGVNADNGGYAITQALESYCQRNRRAFIVKSLGYKNYINAVGHAEAVIGNSSSGIIEVPALKIPTVNIGSRQQGRLCADSVLHCDDSFEGISAAIRQATNPSFRANCLHTVNPYGDGRVSERVLPILKQYNGLKMKQFRDMEFDYAN